MTQARSQAQFHSCDYVIHSLRHADQMQIVVQIQGTNFCIVNPIIYAVSSHPGLLTQRFSLAILQVFN